MGCLLSKLQAWHEAGPREKLCVLSGQSCMGGATQALRSSVSVIPNFRYQTKKLKFSLVGFGIALV